MRLRRKDQLRLVDLIGEATSELTCRMTRSSLSMVAIAVGVGAFVASVSLTQTTRATANALFNSLAPVRIVVSDTQPGTAPAAISSNSPSICSQVPGVEGSGVLWNILASPSTFSSPKSNNIQTAEISSIGVVGATAGIFKVVAATFPNGSPFSNYEDRQGDQVVVLGGNAATGLGIESTTRQQAVLLDGVPFTVVGIIGSVKSEPELMSSVIVPSRAATALWGPPFSGIQIDVLTRSGAATKVSNELPLILDPFDPTRLISATDTASIGIEGTIDGEFASLLRVLAVVAVVMAIAGIGVTMYSAVSDRTSEIGLRRSLGATRQQIAGQIIVEGAILGVLGAIAGACLAVWCVALFARSHGWVFVMNPLTSIASPIGGAVAGIVAGVAPALRASRLAPSEAVRR